MSPFSFAGSEDPAAVLEFLLTDRGIPFRREGEYIRYRLMTRGCQWETVCRCRQREVLVYGRYPFPVQTQTQVLKVCSEINVQALRGAMFLLEGEILFRTCASCAQPLDAAEQLTAALEYNAAIMAEFWPLLQRAAIQKDS